MIPPNKMGRISQSAFWRDHRLVGLILALALVVTHCSTENNLPLGEVGNGGLIVSLSFEVILFVDSLQGRARHMAVNENVDIYVKARFPKQGGNIALRDTTGDGKADV